MLPVPMSAPTRCPEPGCPVLVPRGRCADHVRPAWISPSAWSRVSGVDRAAWRRRRRDQLDAEPFCAGVLTPFSDTRPCGFVAEEADHITELADGGSLLAGELQSLCSSCHRVKTRDASKRRAIVRARAARSEAAGAVSEV